MLQSSRFQTTDAAPNTAPITPHSAVCSATAAISLPILSTKAGTQGEKNPPAYVRDEKMLMTCPRAIPSGTPSRLRRTAVFVSCFIAFTSQTKQLLDF